MRADSAERRAYTRTRNFGKPLFSNKSNMAKTGLMGQGTEQLIRSVECWETQLKRRDGDRL